MCHYKVTTTRLYHDKAIPQQCHHNRTGTTRPTQLGRDDKAIPRQSRQDKVKMICHDNTITSRPPQWGYHKEATRTMLEETRRRTSNTVEESFGGLQSYFERKEEEFQADRPVCGCVHTCVCKKCIFLLFFGRCVYVYVFVYVGIRAYMHTCMHKCICVRV